MNTEDLYRYLEIESVLSNYEIEVKPTGKLDCPFHENCTSSMRLYKELNGIACTRSSCANYRKVYNAFEVLQELEQCNKKEAVLFGKGLLLKELDDLRSLLKGKTKQEKLKESNKVVLSEKGAEFYEELKRYLRERNQTIFTGKALQKDFRVATSTLKKYLSQLTEQGSIEVIGGSRYRGYEYELKKE